MPSVGHALTPEEARAAFESGRRKFEANDHEGAIAYWELARRELDPDTTGPTPVYTTLTFNLVLAHQRAFESAGSQTHLDAAMALLGEFRRSLPVAFEGDEDGLRREMELAEAKQAELDALLEESRKPALGPTPVPHPAPAPLQPTTSTLEPPHSSVDDPPDRPGRALIISGAVLIGGGVAGLAMMGAGMGMAAGSNEFSSSMSLEEREAQLLRGQRGNALSVTGAVVGGTLAATGVALLSAGLVKRKRAIAMAPAVGGGMVGASVAGRF